VNASAAIAWTIPPWQRDNLSPTTFQLPPHPSSSTTVTRATSITNACTCQSVQWGSSDRLTPHSPGPTEVEVTSVWDQQAIITVELKPKIGINYGPVEPTQPSINVIVACSARKTVRVRVGMHLRAIKRATIESRVRTWTSKLQDGCGNGLLPAAQLYCGDAWATARSGIDNYRLGSAASLWVASAGYGLIASSERVYPYSATFSPRHQDSVGANGEKSDRMRWWKGLCDWARSINRQPHSIEELAKRHPSTPLLIAVSPDYLSALASDLLAACAQLTDPDLLVIVSTGSPKKGKLAAHFLPCDARLEHRFGGARNSLNNRIVRHILETTKPEHVRCSLLTKRFKILLGRQPEYRTFNRSTVTDHHVAKFIAGQMRARPDTSHSALLREFRDGNRACAQNRFKRIFNSVKKTVITTP